MAVLTVTDATLALNGVTPTSNVPALGTDTIDPGQFRALQMIVKAGGSATMTIDDPNSVLPGFMGSPNPDAVFNLTTTDKAFLLGWNDIARFKNTGTGLISVVWAGTLSTPTCIIYGIR
jgi:hypothetical protein